MSHTPSPAHLSAPRLVPGNTLLASLLVSLLTTGAAVAVADTGAPPAVPVAAAAAASDPSVPATPGAPATATAEQDAQYGKITPDGPPPIPLILGPIVARPPFISEVEWGMVSGAAAEHASPAQELIRLVNLVRFYKLLEMVEENRATTPPATLKVVAAQLLDEVPLRFRSRSMDVPEAMRLQRLLINELVASPKEREARVAAENRKLFPPLNAPLTPPQGQASGG